jgi:Ca-activated chloride channel family protein
VGLVAFSTAPRTLVEPTTDRAAIHDALNNLEARGGTSMGDAIETSLETAGLDPRSAATGGATTPTPSSDPSASPAPDASASPAPSGSASPEKEKPIVATVLLSDGANSTGEIEPIPAAEEAAALNVPIYTIALGTADGVVTVPDELGQLHTVNVPPDTETLAQIAELTGGRSFEAPTAADLDAIYQSLGSKIGYTSEEREVTQWFAAAGLLLVVAGAGLAAHWFNRFP